MNRKKYKKTIESGLIRTDEPFGTTLSVDDSSVAD